MTTRFRRAGWMCLLLLLGYWLFAFGYVRPALLEDGALFGRVADLSGHSREAIVAYWDNQATRVTWLLLALTVLLGFGPKRLRLDRFFERYVGEADARVLGFLRAVTAGVLCMSVIWEDVAGTARVPAELMRAHGLFKLFFFLPGFESFTRSVFALTVFEWTTLAVLFAAAIGLFTRLTVPLGALSYFIVAGLIRQPTWPFHTGLIPLYALTMLSFTRAGDGFSVDAWLRQRRPARRSHSEERQLRQHYGWARYLWVVVLAVPYGEAGLSKLANGGLLWWEATNMRAILYLDSLNPMEFDFDYGLALASAPDWVYAALGLAAVGGEVAMLGVLFSRRARLLFPAMMAAMHVGILLTQNILFPDLIVMLCAVYGMAWLDRTGGPWDLRTWLSGSTQAPGEVEARGSFAPLPLRALVLVMAFFWVFAIELFPFTAMQMYSKKRSPPLEYYRILAHYESGEVETARPERLLPALHASRYRLALRRCFESDHRHVCDALLDELWHLHNAGAPEERRVRSFEVQKRSWDYLAEADDPEHGRAVARYFAPLSEALPGGMGVARAAE